MCYVLGGEDIWAVWFCWYSWFQCRDGSARTPLLGCYESKLFSYIPYLYRFAFVFLGDFVNCDRTHMEWQGETNTLTHIQETHIKIIKNDLRWYFSLDSVECINFVTHRYCIVWLPNGVVTISLSLCSFAAFVSLIRTFIRLNFAVVIFSRISLDFSSACARTRLLIQSTQHHNW